MASNMSRKFIVSVTAPVAYVAVHFDGNEVQTVVPVPRRPPLHRVTLAKVLHEEAMIFVDESGLEKIKISWLPVLSSQERNILRGKKGKEAMPDLQSSASAFA